MSDMSLSDHGTPVHNAKFCSDQLRRKSVRKPPYQAILQGLAILTLGLVSTAYAADRLSERQAVAIPSHIAGQKLATPLEQSANANQLEQSANANQAVAIPKRVELLVRLKGGPVATHHDKSRIGRMSRKGQLKVEQADFLRRAGKLAPRSKALLSTQMVLNAVVMEVDADQIDAIASDPDVLSVTRVHNYEMDLSETVPYIGAADVQATGVDGSGIKVAVLDSGVDYTHANLGGGGTLTDYQNAYGTGTADSRNTRRDGLFPTAKVVEGYDFVGEQWPSGPLKPDDDPIDFEGHGTHVADIIGGVGGVAPGVDLYAVKVCSAVSSSCSGIALIQGMEYAVDPNGDGDPSDKVNIINMSLGSSYGQPFDDDLAAAVDNASALGVLTVASAGNSGDKPYANGTPAAAPTALSVAQTQVPSAVLPFIEVGDNDYPAVFQPWSVAAESALAGPLQYGNGASGNLNGCAAFASGSLIGKVVLVDRGGCNFTRKISNIGQAGGLIGIIGLIAPGDPFSGSDGGERPIDIPGFMISQANADAMKAAIALGPVNASLDPASALPLVGSIVGSSSRGPQHEAETLIKPEIGAPGASVSAIAGTGNGTGAFGGTSGAAPMVAGSAALLLQSEPGLAPHEAKARLINTAETDITTDPFSGLAPITRTGGGEVRVNRAVTATTAAWDSETQSGALSFGYHDVDKRRIILKKNVEITNYSDEDRQYVISPSFRDAADASSGAVEIKAPGSVKVRAGQSKKIKVTLTIHGESLGGNSMNSGSQGADPAALNAQEYDGYLTFTADTESVHMPWHVLPRQAARVKTKGKGKAIKASGELKPDQTIKFKDGVADLDIDNKGIGIAQNDFYSLVAYNGDLPEGERGQQSPTPDIRAVGVQTVPAAAGFCSGSESFVWSFAINTWERQQHLLPVSFIVYLDTDQDDIDDYVIVNRDASGLGTISDGRQVTWVQDRASGAANAVFFTEHATNTSNTVLRICAEQVGLTAADMGTTNVDVTVAAQDFYYGGPGDLVEGITITPQGEQYSVPAPMDVPGGQKATVEVLDSGPFPGNTPEQGLLLLTNGDRGAGAYGGATEASEAMIIQIK
jgi:subtilisin family serine protease